MQEPETHSSITMSAPDIGGAEIAAVAEVMRSGRLSLGPWQTRFEDAVAGFARARHAIAASSGTAALHVGLVALGLGPGDEIIVPSFTFAASVNVALYVGARPVFADIDPVTYNLNPDDVAGRITPRTRAVIGVDAFGLPAEWETLQKLAHRNSLLRQQADHHR